MHARRALAEVKPNLAPLAARIAWSISTRVLTTGLLGVPQRSAKPSNSAYVHPMRIWPVVDATSQTSWLLLCYEAWRNSS